jgi:hypothetical protein
MSSEDIKIPSRRKLLVVGLVALVIAGYIAVSGIMSRAKRNRELVQWTNEQAVPTVALAQLKKGHARRPARIATLRFIKLGLLGCRRREQPHNSIVEHAQTEHIICGHTRTRSDSAADWRCRADADI